MAKMFIYGSIAVTFSWLAGYMYARRRIRSKILDELDKKEDKLLHSFMSLDDLIFYILNY